MLWPLVTSHAMGMIKDEIKIGIFSKSFSKGTIDKSFIQKFSPVGIKQQTIFDMSLIIMIKYGRYHVIPVEQIGNRLLVKQKICAPA